MSHWYQSDLDRIARTPFIECLTGHYRVLACERVPHINGCAIPFEDAVHDLQLMDEMWAMRLELKKEPARVTA